jgi:hypothetical protein
VILFLVPVIIISFILALGWYTPIFPWLYRNIPTFDMFQGPTRITLLAIFSLGILAGIGAEIWRRPTGRLLYWTRLGTMGAAAVAIGAGFGSLTLGTALGDSEPTFIRSTAIAGLLGVGFGILTLTAPMSGSINEKDSPWSIWHWTACLWVVADLIYAGWGIIPGIDRKIILDDSASAKSIRTMVAGGRLYIPRDFEKALKFEKFFRFDTFSPQDGLDQWKNLRASLLPNITLLDRIPSANNFDPLLPSRYAEWISALEALDEKSKDSLFKLMNVTVLELLDPESDTGIKFSQREAYPRIFWVPCARQAVDSSEALDLVINGNIDFLKEAIIENSPAIDVYCDSSDPSITVPINEPNRFSININTTTPGYLIVSDTWYPGWRAAIDNQSVELLHANYLFRGVQVPAGRHEIEVYYQPRWLNLGGLASLSGIIVWIVLVISKINARNWRKL